MKLINKLEGLIELVQNIQTEDGHDYFVDIACEGGDEIIQALTDYKTLVETLHECPDCMATLQIKNGKLTFVKHAM